jgi:thioesterase domain-containing protein
MGGIIAYEMARQLRDAGEEVGLLGLFDSFPRYGPRRPMLAEWFTQRGNTLDDRRVTSIIRFTGRGVANLAHNTLIAVWRRLFGLTWGFCARTMPVMPRMLFRPLAASHLAGRSYRMQPYAGDAVLFVAEDYRSDHAHMVDNWRALIGGRLDIRPITGLHSDILEEPHVRALAMELSACLRESKPGKPEKTDT